SGTSRWITSQAARADVQRLRAQSSAILTGIGTVLADDPLLSVRDPVLAGAGAAPLRVVLDTRLRMPLSARMLREAGSTLVLCGEADPERRVVALAEAGARVIEVPVAGGRLDLTQVLRTLAGLEVNEVLVEAGPVLTGTMLAAGLVDELVAYVAPRLLGGDAMPMAALGDYSRLEDALHLEITDVRAIGRDWRITARPGSG
ncbi:MAG: RibD family protein, partial [Gammaproteobacteria bacterium]